MVMLVLSALAEIIRKLNTKRDCLEDKISRWLGTFCNSRLRYPEFLQQKEGQLKKRNRTIRKIR